MTRRDRYALALALECLRGSKRDFPEHAIAVLRGSRSELPRDIAAAVDEADYPDDCWGAGARERRRRFSRLLRARLALLLRVLLRADGLDAWSGAPGGYDMEGCEVCHWRGEVPGREHDEECRFCGGYGWTLAPIHITPLWDLAARGASR